MSRSKLMVARNVGSRGRIVASVLVLGLTLIGLTSLLLLERQSLAQPTRLVQAPISVSLKGPFDPAVAGLLVAVRSGLFAAGGLNVALTVDREPIEVVAQGTETIGLTDAHTFLIARQNGAPLVAFAANFLESSVVFFALEATGIRTVTAFAGKRIGLPADGATSLIYQALMSRQQLPRNRVHEVAVPLGIDPLLKGDVDLLAGPISMASALAQTGIPFNIIRPTNYGIHVPGTVYFATGTTVRERPAVVRNFLRAVITGWETAYGDVSGSAPLVSSFDPSRLSPDTVAFLMSQQREFVRPSGRRFAEFDMVQWRTLRQTLLQQRLLTTSVDLTQAVALNFLTEAYRRPLNLAR